MSKPYDQVEDLLAELTSAEKDYADLHAKHEARVAKATAEKNEALEPVTKRISALVTRIQVLADRERSALITTGEKTCILPHGRLRWKLCPDSVVLTDDEDKVIERLEKARRDAALHIVTKLDKKAILKDRNLIKGIRGIKVQAGPEQLMIETDTTKYTARDEPT